MKRYSFLTLCILVLSMFLSVSLIHASSQKQDETILLKFASDIPERGAISKSWTWFMNEIEKQTAGRVKIDRYWGGSLFKTAEQVDSLLAGVADITNINISFRRQLLPLSSAFQLPTTSFPDTPEGLKAASDTVFALMTKYPELAKEYNEFKLLSWNTDPSRILISKSEIRVPADLKGDKVGAEGIYSDIMSVVGAAPVKIPPPATYMNMQRGVINAAVVAWLHVQVFKLWEVASNYLDHGFGQGATCLIMNHKSWNSLPPDIQTMIKDLLPEMMIKGTQGLLGISGVGKKSATEKGGTIYKPTPDEAAKWDAVKKPVEERWLKNMKDLKFDKAPMILEDIKNARNKAWGK